MKKLIRTDRNGTQYFEETCKCVKCGGTGTYKWYGYHWNGTATEYEGECYDCGGRGIQTIETKVYTPEYQAKLDARREKRQGKKLAELKAKREAEEKEQAKREAAIAAEKAKSDYVGQPGEKIEKTVTVAFVSSYEFPSFRGYGMTTMYIYGLKDDQDNLMVWKTASGTLSIETKVYKKDCSDWFCESEYAHKGDVIKIRATVKDHSEYNGQKQTVLTRVKTLEFIEKAGE